jgi:hypothetical protein
VKSNLETATDAASVLDAMLLENYITQGSTPR